MITLQADFNHMDAHGRLRLDDLRMHQHTPFAEIAAKHEPIIFVEGDDMVRGELIHDPDHGWIGQVDWSTQDVWESYQMIKTLAARGFIDREPGTARSIRLQLTRAQLPDLE